MYYYTTYSSPLGEITIASDGKAIIGLWNENQKYHGHGVPGTLVRKDDLPLFDKTKKWLDGYFAGKNPGIEELPLAPAGGAFRRRVWDVLCKIPYGRVITYGEIASKIKCASAQAVGGAVGHNPISIIIPCHRVVGANKNLTGYAGGLRMKMALLKLEGFDISQFLVPTKGTAL